MTLNDFERCNSFALFLRTRKLEADYVKVVEDRQS